MIFTILLAVLLAHSSQAPQEKYIDADTLRTALLDNLVALESIECSYAYCCSERAEGKLDNITLRWKNTWLWYSSRPDNPSEHPHALKHVIESIVDEAVSGYWEESASSRCYHHTNYERLRFMAYNELSPLTILGASSPHSYHSYTANLREMLESTVTPHVMTQDHQTLLYLFPEPADGDYREIATTYASIIYLDDQSRTRQVDYVLRPGCSLEEIQLLGKTDEPRNIYKLFCRDVFEDFREINGYAIPARLHRMLFTPTRNKEYSHVVNNMQQKIYDGTLSPWEYEIMLYKAITDYSIEKEWQVTIDPDSIRINNPDLSRADFEIIPPKEPTVTWDIASGDFVDEFGEGNYEEIKKRTEARRIARIKAKMKKDYSLPIAVAIGAFSAALLATVIALKIRGRR